MEKLEYKGTALKGQQMTSPRHSISGEMEKATHYVTRVAWLRAAVMGANDGIVSTASLIIGVTAAGTSQSGILLAGLAGLIAGAMSMAAGEYVSVSAQSDSENADLAREKAELALYPESELAELAGLYEIRGLSTDLAMQVAKELTDHDALEAHARDELGITDQSKARPVQAALTSATTFSTGAALPLAAVIFAPVHSIIWVTPTASILVLTILGYVSAKTGGAPVGKAIERITIWGAAAMAATAAVGWLFNVAMG